MEHLGSTNLNILNKEPTFIISDRKETRYLTLRTGKTGDLVTNWNVSDEFSLSDHRYSKLVTWNLSGPHIAIPREPTGNPIGKI
jgi:hypothetical protein